MVPKHLIQKILKSSEILFGHKIHLENVHKNTQKIQEPGIVSFLYTPNHVPGVHCMAKICISKSLSTYKSANILLSLHNNIHTFGNLKMKTLYKLIVPEY